MVGVVLAFAVLNRTGSAADLGLVLAARSVPLVAALLAGGVIADRPRPVRPEPAGRRRSAAVRAR